MPGGVSGDFRSEVHDHSVYIKKDGSVAYTGDQDHGGNRVYNIGEFQLPAYSSAPPSPNTGDVYWNTTSNKIFRWDGASWIEHVTAGSDTRQLPFHFPFRVTLDSYFQGPQYPEVDGSNNPVYGLSEVWAEDLGISGTDPSTAASDSNIFGPMVPAGYALERCLVSVRGEGTGTIAFGMLQMTPDYGLSTVPGDVALVCAGQNISVVNAYPALLDATIVAGSGKTASNDGAIFAPGFRSISGSHGDVFGHITMIFRETA